MKGSIADLRIEAIAEEQEVTKQSAAEQFVNQSEYAEDLSKLPKQEHNWYRRGIKVSCEGANHPHHSHFLR